jgi:hypothetical protein
MSATTVASTTGGGEGDMEMGAGAGADEEDECVICYTAVDTSGRTHMVRVVWLYNTCTVKCRMQCDD